jgi:large subunit ribosomal protein L29
MKPSEVRELPEVELDRKLRESRGELVSLRLKQATGQVENTARFRELRKDIARLETIKGEKARAAAAK